MQALNRIIELQITDDAAHDAAQLELDLNHGAEAKKGVRPWAPGWLPASPPFANKDRVELEILLTVRLEPYLTSAAAEDMTLRVDVEGPTSLCVNVEWCGGFSTLGIVECLHSYLEHRLPRSGVSVRYCLTRWPDAHELACMPKAVADAWGIVPILPRDCNQFLPRAWRDAVIQGRRFEEHLLEWLDAHDAGTHFRHVERVELKAIPCPSRWELAALTRSSDSTLRAAAEQLAKKSVAA